jgi:hypothetical protein
MLMKHHQSSSFYNLKTYVHAGHLDLVQWMGGQHLVV